MSRTKCSWLSREKWAVARTKSRPFSSMSRSVPRRISLFWPNNSTPWDHWLAILISDYHRRKSQSSSTYSWLTKGRNWTSWTKKLMASSTMKKSIRLMSSWEKATNRRVQKAMSATVNQMLIQTSKSASRRRKKLKKRCSWKTQPASTRQWILSWSTWESTRSRKTPFLPMIDRPSFCNQLEHELRDIWRRALWP